MSTSKKTTAKKASSKAAKVAVKKLSAKDKDNLSLAAATVADHKKAEAKKAAPKADKPLSGLDAAALILKGAKEPMNAIEITKAAFQKGLWTPAGKTPAATLSSAIQREVATKGKNSRFTKASPGHYKLA